jgi:hypothetical protein
MPFSNRLPTLLTLMASLISPALFADQNVISDDGREVVIKDDGSWAFRSEDRFANTRDGRRIKLKADGSWVYVGNAPLVTKEQARSTIVDLKLQKIEIEAHKEKVHKNTRTERQTVFYINVDVSPLATQSLRIANTKLDSIVVMDDKGNKYPVLSITPGNTEVAPDTNQTFALRAKDAPTLWDGAELMEIQLPAKILGNPEPATFSRKLYDIEEVRVKGFDQ